MFIDVERYIRTAESTVEVKSSSVTQCDSSWNPDNMTALNGRWKLVSTSNLEEYHTAISELLLLESHRRHGEVASGRHFQYHCDRLVLAALEQKAQLLNY